MLRYLRVVQEMKKILSDNNLTVMATVARYACAYEAIAKPDWWTKSISMGPIIEQGTHFCSSSCPSHVRAFLRRRADTIVSSSRR